MNAIQRAGRPRDPHLEDRVHSAACRVYGRLGWAGFTIDAVAREAGVGKASIYLRWSGRTPLLVDSLVTLLVNDADIDTGCLRDDLSALAGHFLAIYHGDLKEAALRMTSEASLTPELRASWEQWRAAQVGAARATVRRGIARGELSSDASVTLILDTLFGATLMHALVTPEELGAGPVQGYAEELADFVLRAACPGTS